MVRQRIHPDYVRMGDKGVFAVSAGGRVSAACERGKVVARRVTSGRSLFSFAAPEQTCCVGVSPDGRLVAAGGNRLIVADVRARTILFEKRTKTTSILAWSVDHLATEGENVSIWRTSSGRKVRRLDEPSMEYGAASSHPGKAGAFSPDGRHLAVVKNRFVWRFGHTDDDVYGDALLLWDVSTGGAACKDMRERNDGSWPIVDDDMVLIGFDREGSRIAIARIDTYHPSLLEWRRVPELALLGSWTKDELPPGERKRMREAAAGMVRFGARNGDRIAFSCGETAFDTMLRAIADTPSALTDSVIQ